MYSNAVLNIFNNPKNAGRISKPDGIADCFNSESTAHVEFSLRIENGIIKNCQFRAQANPYIVAICSTMTTMVKGKMVSMLFIDPYSIKKELGDESSVDIEFCIDCLKMAIVDYKEKLEKTNKNNKTSISSDEEVIEETIEETEENEIKETLNELEKTRVELETENSDDSDDDFADFFDFLDEE